jgi:hypothetical protein
VEAGGELSGGATDDAGAKTMLVAHHKRLQDAEGGAGTFHLSTLKIFRQTALDLSETGGKPIRKCVSEMHPEIACDHSDHDDHTDDVKNHCLDPIEAFATCMSA